MGDFEVIACWYHGGDLRQLPVAITGESTLADVKAAIARQAGFLVRTIELSLGFPAKYSLEQFDQTMSADSLLSNHCNVSIIRTTEDSMTNDTSHEHYVTPKNPWNEYLESDWKYDPSQVDNMFEDVKVVKGFLTEHESKTIIELTEQIGYGKLDFSASYRTNLRIVVRDPVLADALLERVRYYVPDVMQDLKGDSWKLCGLNECFRYCKYIEGQFFRKHCDGSFAKSMEEESFITLNMYLNSGFEGGATRFYLNDSERDTATHRVDPEPGLALFFNHKTKDYLHDGEDVAGGVPKYLMRTDVMYKRIRQDSDR